MVSFFLFPSPITRLVERVSEWALGGANVAAIAASGSSVQPLAGSLNRWSLAVWTSPANNKVHLFAIKRVSLPCPMMSLQHENTRFDQLKEGGVVASPLTPFHQCWLVARSFDRIGWDICGDLARGLPNFTPQFGEMRNEIWVLKWFVGATRSRWFFGPPIQRGLKIFKWRPEISKLEKCIVALIDSVTMCDQL